MKLTKQTMSFLHLPFDVCIQDASKQHSLLQGYSCLQNVQAIHQQHTRHVAIHISSLALLMYIQTQIQSFVLDFTQCKLYLTSDHMCLGLQSSQVSTIFQITYSWTDRLMSLKLPLRKHSARLQPTF